jgi:hypothetical protein
MILVHNSLSWIAAASPVLLSGELGDNDLARLLDSVAGLFRASWHDDSLNNKGVADGGDCWDVAAEFSVMEAA